MGAKTGPNHTRSFHEISEQLKIQIKVSMWHMIKFLPWKLFIYVKPNITINKWAIMLNKKFLFPPAAQWVKYSPARFDSHSRWNLFNGKGPIYTDFHYYRSNGSIWIKYFWKGCKKRVIPSLFKNLRIQTSRRMTNYLGFIHTSYSSFVQKNFNCSNPDGLCTLPD